MPILKPNASPSDNVEANIINVARINSLEALRAIGVITVATAKRHYVNRETRISSVHIFRGANGTANTTSIDLYASINGAAAAKVAAQLDFDFLVGVVGDAANTRKPMALLDSDPAWDGYGIVLQAGDYFYFDITAAEANATDLLIDVDLVN